MCGMHSTVRIASRESGVYTAVSYMSLLARVNNLSGCNGLCPRVGLFLLCMPEKNK